MNRNTPCHSNILCVNAVYLQNNVDFLGSIFTSKITTILALVVAKRLLLAFLSERCENKITR